MVWQTTTQLLARPTGQGGHSKHQQVAAEELALKPAHVEKIDALTTRLLQSTYLPAHGADPATSAAFDAVLGA